ncbi:MFS transporter [Massilia norwichensis]|uniref:MFS transporter n=1 Tax=Massilia norwichensis TaxID=1442366 RepID=A0ABT2A192_9BURK|nr:MFS transporter [Massilia norwichensis]MCS0587926.1 MFS transporter [Massilia norwichensis]
MTRIRGLLRKLGGDQQLRNPDFRRFWFSSILTNFGAQITLLALPICAALLLHATPSQMGTLAALGSLPFLLFGLPVGVLLDRSRRLPVMLCSDAMVALSLASVPIAWWQGWLDMHWLYAVEFVLGTGYVVGGGAEQIFVTFLVGRDGLIDAQSKFAATESASRLLGPGLAGILVQALGAPFAILCNVAGFTVSIWNLRRIRACEPQPVPPEAHVLRDMLAGLAFVWRHPTLRLLAWTSACWHLLFYGYMALYVLFATRVLGMSAGMMGTAQMLGGVGVLASSVLLKPLTRRFGAGGTVVIGLCASSIGFMLMPAIPRDLLGSSNASAAAYAIVVFWLDCGATLFFLPYLALRQRVTPDAFLGRMTSTMRFMTVAMAPVGAAGAGLLAEHIGVRGGLAVVAGGALLLTASTLLGTRLHRVEG